MNKKIRMKCMGIKIELDYMNDELQGFRHQKPLTPKQIEAIHYYLTEEGFDTLKETQIN